MSGYGGRSATFACGVSSEIASTSWNAILFALWVSLEPASTNKGHELAAACGIYHDFDIPLRSQEEIGQGGGLSGSIRNFTSAIAVAVYTATLSNRLLTTIPQEVYPVARRLGLPERSLAALASALKGASSYDSVPGLTPAIKAAVQAPFRLAFKNAASTVFLVILAFSGTAIILAFFTTNSDKSTEHYVAGGLHGTKDEKKYLEELKHEQHASLTPPK
ncbi:hypothetical protein EDD37DRAFT_613912 [Exophiala viscosa]|uniref:uncharacterized protein n=1 Tax=Exophiala viscosa TaxID=2486360 RepID=UPI0021997086|nr:hypothetical protein EDD37DRAFT_613912 [Exophiala viscosa]